VGKPEAHPLAGRRALADKRSGERASVALELTVRGATGSFSAQTVDISRTGALLWITDEGFLPPEDLANMVVFSEHVAHELGDGMVLTFPADGVTRQAEVVRVTRKGQDVASPMLVACRFAAPLENAEWTALGLPPQRNGARPSGALPEPAGAAALPDGERRAVPRVEHVLCVQLLGDYGSYEAAVLNLSSQGVLVAMTDPRLMPARPDQLVVFTKRLVFQFRNGLALRFLETDVTIEADLVRVSERVEGTEVIPVVGARFRRALTPGELARLEADGALPPLPPGPESEPRSPEPAPRAHPDAGLPSARIYDLLKFAMEGRASDLHLKAGSPARLRVHGRLSDVGAERLTAAHTDAMARELMSPPQAARFEAEGDLEMGLDLPRIGRFRVNILRQRGETSLAIRCIPSQIPKIEGLGISEVTRRLADRPRGLVLVAGPTGAGKSHTLAAMVDHVNRTRECHILTLEDPIEFLHADVKCHITQREVGRDCVDFASGLKRALRQDPDVILVGEMRDLETIALALTAAETGHLVFATLHTSSASQCPERIVDVFPAGQQEQIRLQLSGSLQGIMCQILVPTLSDGLVAVQEILVANDAVRSLIREGKTPQLYNIMQTGAREGMQTLEAALNELVQAGLVSHEAAVSRANLPDQILRR